MLLGVLRQNKLYLKKFIAKIFTQLQKSKYIINHKTLASKSSSFLTGNFKIILQSEDLNYLHEQDA